MIRLVANKGDFDEWLRVCPFEIHVEREPDEGEFPLLVKFIKVQIENLEVAEMEEHIFVAILTFGELYEIMAPFMEHEERQLDGYNYAESKKAVADRSRSAQGQIDALHGYSSRSEVRGDFVSDENIGHKTGEIGGYEEYTGEERRIDTSGSDV